MLSCACLDCLALFEQEPADEVVCERIRGDALGIAEADACAQPPGGDEVLLRGMRDALSLHSTELFEGTRVRLMRLNALEIVGVCLRTSTS